MSEKYKSPCTLDWETADNITRIVLDNTRKDLKQDLENFYNEKDNSWLHPDDVILQEKVIRSIDFLLSHWFGNEK